MDPVTIYLIGAVITGLATGPALAESGYVGGMTAAEASLASALVWPVAVPALVVLTTGDALENVASADPEDSPWSVE